jgi:branched-chain amino acid transport system substrate-binding protein
MRRNTRRTAVILSVPLVLTMFTACGSSSSSNSSKSSSSSSASSGSGSPIKIGILAPLTGIDAQYGVQVKANWDYAIQQINKRGGISGRQIITDVFDDAADPTQDVVGVTKLLTQDKVDLVLGPVTSDGTLAVLPRTTRANTFEIVDAGVPTLTPQTMPYAFSALMTAGDQGSRLVTYAKSKGYQSAAILHDSGAQGTAASKVMQQQMQQQGITLTGTDQFNLGSTDMTTQLLKLKQGNPKVLLVYPASADDLGHILVGMKQLGLNIPVLGPVGVPTETGKVAGQAALTDLATISFAELGTCPGQTISGKVTAFAAGQQAFDPRTFVGMNLGPGIANYDAVWIMKAAVEGSGSTDGAKMAAWLETHATSLSSSLVGPAVSASSTSHFLYGPQDMVVVQTSQPGPDGTFTRADC